MPLYAILDRPFSTIIHMEAAPPTATERLTVLAHSQALPWQLPRWTWTRSISCRS